MLSRSTTVSCAAPTPANRQRSARVVAPYRLTIVIIVNLQTLARHHARDRGQDSAAYRYSPVNEEDRSPTSIGANERGLTWKSDVLRERVVRGWTRCIERDPALRDHE